MFDGAKIEIHDPELMERFRGKTGLAVLTPTDRATGEMPRDTQTARLLNLRLTCHPTGRNVIQGSLHRYANGGTHNADAFTHGRFCRTVEQLADLLEFDPATAKIRALEVGVNLTLPAADVLTRIIAYKGQPPDVDTFGGRGYEKRWEFGNYTLKGYDKGRQYNLPESVMRWELATNRMRYLSDNGLTVATLADLLDPRRVERFGPLLAGLFADVTFADLTDLDRLTGAERKFYEQAVTFQFWEKIKDRERRRYARGRFDEVRANGGANEREQITELIQQTGQDLLTGRAGAPPENSHVFTNSRKLEIPTFSPFKYRVNLWELPPSANRTPPRTCKTCGAGIEHRKPEAVFCELKRCRNVDSNPRNNFKRRYARAVDACQLFDPLTVLRLTPEQIRLVAY